MKALEDLGESSRGRSFQEPDEMPLHESEEGSLGDIGQGDGDEWYNDGIFG